VELGISKKTLRQKLTLFQRDLKAVLFDGGATSIALTEAGRIYRGQLAEIFGNLRRVTGGIPREDIKGRLSIAAGASLGSLWLMPRLKHFERQWPNIHVELVPQRDRGAPAGDLEMIFSATPPRRRVVHLSAGIQLFPVCSPALISSRPFNTVGDLLNMTLLHCDRGEEWRKWLRVAKAGPLDGYRSFKLSNASLAVQAAVQGHGVALASHITASHLLSAGKLLVPYRESVFSSHQMYIISEHALSAKAAPVTFLTWAAEQLREGRKHPAFDACA
jgi:LysR family glycine cleavage system transcriptional activator